MTKAEFCEVLRAADKMTPALYAIALIFLSADKLKAAGFLEVNYWPLGAKAPAWTVRL